MAEGVVPSIGSSSDEEKIRTEEMELQLPNRIWVPADTQIDVPSSASMAFGHRPKLSKIDISHAIAKLYKANEAEQAARQALEMAEKGMSILSEQPSINEVTYERLLRIIETENTPFKPLALKALAGSDESKVESCFINHLLTATLNPFKELHGGRTIEKSRAAAARAFSQRKKLSVWGHAEVLRQVTDNRVKKIRALGGIVSAHNSRDVDELALESSIVPPELLSEAEEIYDNLVLAGVKSGTVDILGILLDKTGLNSGFGSWETTNSTYRSCETKRMASCLSEFEENQLVDTLEASILADRTFKAVWRRAHAAAERLSDSELEPTHIQELLTLKDISEFMKGLTITALTGNQVDDVDAFLLSELLNCGTHSSDATRRKAASALKVWTHLSPRAEQALRELITSDNGNKDRTCAGLSAFIFLWTGERNLDRESARTIFAYPSYMLAGGIKRSPKICKEILTILLEGLGLNFYDPSSLPSDQIEQFLSDLQNPQTRNDKLVLTIRSLSIQAKLSLRIIQELVKLITSKKDLEVRKAAAGAYDNFTPLPDTTEILNCAYDTQAESELPLVFSYSCRESLGSKDVLKLFKHLCKYNLGDKAESMSGRLDLTFRSLMAHENRHELFNKTFLSELALPLELVKSLLSLLMDEEEQQERIVEFKKSLEENGLPSNLVDLNVAGLERTQRMYELTAEEVKVIDNIIEFRLNSSSLLQNSVIQILKSQKYEVLMEMSQSTQETSLVRKLRTVVLGIKNIPNISSLSELRSRNVTDVIELERKLKVLAKDSVDTISSFLNNGTPDNFKRYISSVPFEYKSENLLGTAMVKKNFERKFVKLEMTAKFDDTSSMWNALVYEALEPDSWLHLDCSGNGLLNMVGLCDALKVSKTINLVSLILSHNCFTYGDLTYLLEFSTEHLPQLRYIFLDHNLIFCTSNNFEALTVGFSDSSGISICPPLLNQEKVKHLDISMNFMPRHKITGCNSRNVEIFHRLEGLRSDQRNYCFKKILNSKTFYSKYCGPPESVVSTNSEDRAISETIGTVSLFVTKGLTSELTSSLGFSLSGHTYIIIERIDHGNGQREVIKADLVMIDKRVRIRLFRISPAEINKLRDSGNTWVRTAWVETANIEKLLKILFSSLDTSEFHTYSTLNSLNYPGHYNCFSWAVDQLKEIGINTSWTVFMRRPMGCALV